MNGVLIFTNNVMNEMELLTKLGVLNVEFYCCKSSVSCLLIAETCKLVNTVIVSETIPSKEIKKLFSISSEQNLPILIRVEKDNLVNVQQFWSGNKTVSCIDKELSLNEFREVLSSVQKNITTPSVFRGTVRYSRREKLLINAYINSGRSVLSKEELCKFIWNESPDSSKLAMLSVLIKRVNDKNKDIGFEVSFVSRYNFGYEVEPALLQYLVDRGELTLLT